MSRCDPRRAAGSREDIDSSGVVPTLTGGCEMTVETDRSEKFAGYAHPERLVSGDWLEAHLGEPGLVVVESDEDVLLYETGHIPGSVKIDWHTDLNDPVERDYIDGAA